MNVQSVAEPCVLHPLLLPLLHPLPLQCVVVIAVIISSRVSSLKYAWLGPAVSRWYGSVSFGSVRLARGTDDLVDMTVDAFAFRSSNFEIR